MSLVGHRGCPLSRGICHSVSQEKGKGSRVVPQPKEALHCVWHPFLQDDLLYESLTVYETLYYAAMLRLPRRMSADEKRARVNTVIQALGLETCKDTIIGTLPFCTEGGCLSGYCCANGAARPCSLCLSCRVSDCAFSVWLCFVIPHIMHVRFSASFAARRKGFTIFHNHA